MSLITIGTDLVDVCDIAIVAASGSTCVVYFQDGTYISSALTAAAQVAAVNGAGDGALLTTVVTSSNFGSCYIAGQQVKRVRASGANSIWELWSGLGPVYVSGVDVTAAGVLIDATVACGGGGGGGGGMYAQSGSAELTFDYLDNVAAPAEYAAPWTFVGTDGSETVGVVTLTVQFENALTVAAGLATLGAPLALPYPPDDDYVHGTFGGFNFATPTQALISDGYITIFFNADSGSAEVLGEASFQYTTGAS